VLAELVVMQAAQQVRMVVELVSGTEQLVKVVAMIAGRCPFISPFTDDAQLLLAEFGHPRQHFLKIHHASLPGTSLAARRKPTAVAKFREAGTSISAAR
jgi:hypothetical protein